MRRMPCLACGGSILNNYSVKLYPRAYRDMDKIYAYIAYNLLEPGVDANLVNELETAILSLEQFPDRGAARRTGIYANGDYRQLFVKNYVIIYRVLHEQREAHVVTVRYAASEF